MAKVRYITTRSFSPRDAERASVGRVRATTPSTGSSGIQIVLGFTLQGGTGVEWWFSQSLALNVGARYQWTRFLQDFGGERTYQGPSYDLGLTYKFQYR